MIRKTISLTTQGKADLEQELAELIAQRPAIAERIATARAFGDLSENEEYSAARSEQKTVENRILEIQDILKNAAIIKSTTAAGTVGLGSVVKITLAGKETTYTLVGPVEADPLSGKISNESPIGKALLGRKSGEEFTLPNGNTGTILEVA